MLLLGVRTLHLQSLVCSSLCRTNHCYTYSTDIYVVITILRLEKQWWIEDLCCHTCMVSILLAHAQNIYMYRMALFSHWRLKHKICFRDTIHEVILCKHQIIYMFSQENVRSTAVYTGNPLYTRQHETVCCIRSEDY